MDVRVESFSNTLYLLNCVFFGEVFPFLSNLYKSLVPRRRVMLWRYMRQCFSQRVDDWQDIGGNLHQVVLFHLSCTCHYFTSVIFVVCERTFPAVQVFFALFFKRHRSLSV